MIFIKGKWFFDETPNRATAEYCLKQWQEYTLKRTKEELKTLIDNLRK